MFADEDGRPVDGMPQILVTMKLPDEENNKRVMVRSRFMSDEALQQVLGTGVIRDSLHNSTVWQVICSRVRRNCLIINNLFKKRLELNSKIHGQ